MRLPRDTVLMVLDVQEAIDDHIWGPRNNAGAEDRIASLIAAWRGAGLPIIHIRHDSIEPRSPYRPGAPGHGFKPEAIPLPGEIVIAKETNSAFIGTGLEQRLDALGATDLVVCGVLTNNSVETTVRHAGNLGYRVFVPGDACWAVDKRDLTGTVWPAETVHQLSLANMHGEYAVVAGTTDILAALGRTLARRPSAVIAQRGEAAGAACRCG